MSPTLHTTENGKVLNWASHIEDNTLEQAMRTAKLPFVHGHLALMPDAHWGMGATIGSVIPTRGAIIPAAVGVDIGCGMIAVETDLTANRLPNSLDDLLDQIEQKVPAGVGKGHEGELRFTAYSNFATSRDGVEPRLSDKQWVTARKQFGSLGSGNHFVEVCLDERDVVWLVLHSGSRGIGNQLATLHIENARRLMARYFIDLEDRDLAYLVEGTPEFAEYIGAMQWAQDYAMANRQEMVNAVLPELFLACGGGTVVSTTNCHHNYTEMEHHNGTDVWLTRKGAIRARTGDRGVIPGSMGTSSFIVSGLGNAASYNSCSHGAGRRLGRKAAHRELSIAEFEASMGDRTWQRGQAAALLDEAPLAYKDVEQVMRDQADLVTIEHTLHQVLNYKGIS